MLKELNPLKIIEQLSPAEKLVGFIMALLVILLPTTLEQFDSDESKAAVLAFILLVIFSVAIFASAKNQKIQGVIKKNRYLVRDSESLDNELKQLRERERQLLVREMEACQA